MPHTLNSIQYNEEDDDEGLPEIDIFIEGDWVVLNPQGGDGGSINIHRRNIAALILELQKAEANMREQDLATSDDVEFSDDVEIQAVSDKYQ